MRPDGTVTAGNASGVNDGACALCWRAKRRRDKYGLEPRARVVATAVLASRRASWASGPCPASRKVLAPAKLSLDHMDVIELNEAFAAQALAVLRQLGFPDEPRT